MIEFASTPEAELIICNNQVGIAFDQQGIKQGLAPSLRNFIDGFIMSTAGASATMTVGPGQANDSTNLHTITRSASVAKTTAAWIAGAGGGLDTGAIAPNVWYHWFAIKNITTGVSDVLFSLSVSAPTLPTGYTKFRRVGSMKTSVSSQWISFSQFGDEFLWVNSVVDVNTSNAVVGPILFTISVPIGVKVRVSMSGYIYNATNGVQTNFYSPDGGNNGVNGGIYGISVANSYASVTGPYIRTNTSGQVIVNTNSSGQTLVVNTCGWIDSRGKDQ